MSEERTDQRMNGENNTEREKLMRNVQNAAFAAYDTMLYLDTHPHDRAGVEKYRVYVKMLNNAKAEYEEKYGPLSAADAGQNGVWDLNRAPFPWQ